MELLDEVDLILHPLKSELNWPLGEKLPLDLGMTNGSIGLGGDGVDASGGGTGLRWKVPFVLIDAILAAQSPGPLAERVTTKDMKGSAKALSALAEIQSAIADGYRDKILQSIPHLVLLDKDFYKRRILGPLARWVNNHILLSW